MKIIALQNNDVPMGELILQKEETLIVEMTQEEYQKCCAILYREKIEDDKQRSVVGINHRATETYI